MNNLLSSIHGSSDVQALTAAEKLSLCTEIRQKIMEAVSANGGHLSSNLGVVELSVALLSAFNLPQDSVIWDVGHQCYAFKLLTGRAKDFATVRTEGGLSGFPSRDESQYDLFTTGHSSTSISSALGVAAANQIVGNKDFTVAVIGDGSLTGGLAFEGLNNAGRRKKNFIVILNDNNMSISKNVGSVARYLGFIRTKPGYIRAKVGVESVFNKIPYIGKKLAVSVRRAKTRIKKTFYNSTIFEDLGFAYYGPYDGHDLGSLIEIMKNAKEIKKPVLIHVRTTKGKGYDFAETNPKDFHGVSSFDAVSGKLKAGSQSFSSVFGEKLISLAKENEKLCAITAAMSIGTGLYDFSQKYKERFFDVGIAEAHAVTFAGGLARKGLIPVFAVYSTFLQRAFDNIIHDVALQKLKVILAVDRAGVVGEDGRTHQGVFDVSMLKSVPGATIFSPTYFDELEHSLEHIVRGSYTTAVLRYPRGSQGFKPLDYQFNKEDFQIYGKKEAKTAIVTYGRTFCSAVQAVDIATDLQVIKLLKILPIPQKAVSAAVGLKKVIFAEEALGGMARDFGIELYKAGFKGKFIIKDIENGFVSHASMESQLEKLQLDTKGLLNEVENN